MVCKRRGRKYTPKKVCLEKTQQPPQDHEFEHHLSSLSAPQTQMTHSEARSLLPDVLNYRGRSNVLHTYERGTSMAARRFKGNGKSYQQSKIKEDNTESNITFIQHAQKFPDEILPNPIVQSHPIHTTADAATAGDHVLRLSESNICSPSAVVATIGADDVRVTLNLNSQEEKIATTSVINSKPTQSLNVTEIFEQMNTDDESEVDSLACGNNLISVRGYKIKPQYVDLLTSVFSRYGDIGAKCSDKPVPIRSFYMEYVCDVLEKLEHTEFMNLTRNEIKDILASLSHFEGENVNVGWLKERVQMIYEANMAVSMLRSSGLKQSLMDKKSKIQRLEKELEFFNNDYAIKKAELADLEKKMCEAKKVLSEEVEEVTATKTLISEYKAKLKYVFELKSLDQNLT